MKRRIINQKMSNRMDFTQKRPDLPPDLIRLTQLLLNRNPNQRPTASSILKAFAHLRDSHKRPRVRQKRSGTKTLPAPTPIQSQLLNLIALPKTHVRYIMVGLMVSVKLYGARACCLPFNLRSLWFLITTFLGILDFFLLNFPPTVHLITSGCFGLFLLVAQQTSMCLAD